MGCGRIQRERQKAVGIPRSELQVRSDQPFAKDGYRFKVDPVNFPGTRSEDNKRKAGCGATHAKTIPFASQTAKGLAGKQPQQLFLLD